VVADGEGEEAVAAAVADAVGVADPVSVGVGLADAVEAAVVVSAGCACWGPLPPPQAASSIMITTSPAHRTLRRYRAGSAVENGVRRRAGAPRLGAATSPARDR
jgi:hypothetical protein